MNRIIKFRAFWRDTLKPVEDYMSEYWVDSSNDGFIINQFTGILDKKGNEIYDGDFLNVGENSFIKMKVVWDNEKHRWAKMYLDIPNYCQGFIKGEEPYLEVLGNIYETAELITKQ